MTADLAELLARVEKAEGPDRELNQALFAALVPGGFHNDNAGLWVHHGVGWRFPNNFTGSLDAALDLVERVLPGWSWGVSGATKPKCDALLYEPSPGGYRQKIKASATTPAPALLAALLMALIARADA